MHKKTITQQELVVNLKILREKIARKPVDYIPLNDWPHSIEDCFSRYIRTSHVNLILSLSDFLRIKFDWPFPFFALSLLSQSKNWVLISILPFMAWSYICILLESLFHRSPDYKARKVLITRIIDKGMVKLVRLSSRKLFRRWRSSKMLAAHHQELMEIQKVYNRGYWYLCVTAVFPLLDYMCRELLRTDNLTKGVGHINKIFSDANICLESLRPGYGAWNYARETGGDPQEISNTI